MKKNYGLIALILFIYGAGSLFGQTNAKLSEPVYKVKAQYNIMVPMRDGVKLSTDVYRPKAAGKFPVLLTRTPYDNYNPKQGYYFASRGYVVVLQDVRGRYDSEGEFYPFINEQKDGYDTQEWAATQPWSNGSIGTYGGSYVAATQWQAALLHNSHVKAMFPYVGGSDIFNHWVYCNGAFALSINVFWGAVSVSTRTSQEIMEEPVDWMHALKILPISSIPDSIGRRVPWYKDWLKNSVDNDYWQRWSIEDKYSGIDIPVFDMSGWYDIFIQGTITNYLGMTRDGKTEKARQSQKLMIGPWYHTSPDRHELGQIDFGPAAGQDLNQLMLRWFDYWLKGIDNGIMDEPPVKLFVMGKNEWRDENEWPLKRTQYVNFYFQSNDAANTLYGDGRLNRTVPGKEKVDTFDYNPADPTPTVGGNSCCRPQLVPEGPCDQRAVEMRNDVLVYTSEVLSADLEVTGPITAKLFAATSAVNTDFTVKLVDVYPGGKAMNISEGIIRSIYRNSLEDIEWTEPGKVYEYNIELRPTSNVFFAGHRLRVEISSSNFPRYDRNLNTKILGGSAEMVTAKQTIYHNNKYPSCIVLPVIPTEK